MKKRIKLGDIPVEVIFKDIKNVHLSVYPPTGQVRISAPSRMNIDTIRVYAISRLGWIKRQRKKLREQKRETRREYLERESHYVWGKRFLLTIQELNQAPSVELKHNKMILRVRPGIGINRKHAILEEWYRKQIRKVVPALIAKWEPIIGVKVGNIFVQRMKTRWGGCNPTLRNVRLNTDLAKKPRECLEYIMVHEMTHLREPGHNQRFREMMDQYISNWEVIRDELNRLPIRHMEWVY